MRCAKASRSSLEQPGIIAWQSARKGWLCSTESSCAHSLEAPGSPSRMIFASSCTALMSSNSCPLVCCGLEKIGLLCQISSYKLPECKLQRCSEAHRCRLDRFWEGHRNCAVYAASEVRPSGTIAHTTHALLFSFAGHHLPAAKNGGAHFRRP